jgi:hypothetical protein
LGREIPELHQSAQALIHNPAARADWNAVVGEVRERIDGLKMTGSRTAAEQVFKKIQEAVNKSREDLLDNAVKWWTYDKQLYNLKRIARTEMATAAHRAVIASVEGDDSIIGFQWRLSGSHPATDVCDYYANIDMGLGKGVWTKEAVPHHKAHPHCMCLLIPRVTPISQKGSTHYADFVRNSPKQRREQLLPKWANQLNGLGMPLDNLIRPDGMGLVTRQALKERLGADKFDAANALSKALSNPKWGQIDPKAHKSKAKRTIADFMPHQDNPEVAAVIQRLQAGQPIDSFDYHYLYRRFVDGEPLRSRTEYAKRLDGIVRGKDNPVYLQQSGKHKRYAVYHPGDGWSAIIDGQSGQWVSGFKLHDGIEPSTLGEYQWTIKNIILS